MSGRHAITDEDGRELSGPFVYFDAYIGLVREVQSDGHGYDSEPVDASYGTDTGHWGKHRRPLHRCAIAARTIPPVTFYVR